MNLYTIGDLHLHFGSVLKAKNQIEGKVWQNHEEMFRRNCEKLIRPEDTLVLVGDHSWGRNLAEAEKDLEYICNLPGRKILLRGNHDMFWDALFRKAGVFAEQLFRIRGLCLGRNQGIHL